MSELLAPITPSELQRELDGLEPIGRVGNLEIHIIDGDAFPATLMEIGRIRESVFREVGAGRGVDCDLDELDRGPLAYRQLLVWDPEHLELVAMYRYQLAARSQTHGDQLLRTSRLFDYSPTFRRDYLPRSIELGRSVVNPDARRRRQGFFALWSGLGAVLRSHPEIRYYFGNVSLYRNMPEAAQQATVAFLESSYAAPAPLLTAKAGLRYRPQGPDAEAAGRSEPPDNPRGRIKALRALLSQHDGQIPPILQSYMGLGLGIYFGETALDRDFGDALEVGIVVPIKSIGSDILERFVNS
ncbi:GNAT family N-acyltransferase [Gammaproteobacteria bacterium AB-CW1]|uniref:L-ornithine N(alpha)-acyltransferase n=1 Tax=Natronospira elongata TaxID=3110268 RepID=A0AAP6MND4_9GAMM|nr:GNAT family N-acyltransferase [Gammaproteobacteria bacterium AB-CW1]